MRLPVRPPHHDPGAPLLSSDTPHEPPPGPGPGGSPSAQAGGLAWFNHAPSTAAEAALRDCCGSHRWARRVAAHRPYPTVEALLAAADEAAYDLTNGDLAEALAGEATTPLADRGGLIVHTALRAAHAHYEAKFGHAFLLALDDPAAADPAEALDRTLDSLRERLGHDEDQESVATAEQLRRISRARLIRLAAGGRPPARHTAVGTAAGSPDRAGSITPALPRGTQHTSRRYDGRGRWTVPGRA